MLEALFGNKTAEKVLLYLQNYDEGYGREIAETFSIPLVQVQNQLRRFEQGGLLVSKLNGRTRVYRWNPRNPFVPKVQQLLEQILGFLSDTELKKYYRRRQRPRKPGKPL